MGITHQQRGSSVFEIFTKLKIHSEAMNGFFDGDFRRKPNVSIGGASRKLNKEELLAKAQKEREERQVVRLKNASALKIQCCFRSFTARKRAKNVMRNKFDALKANYKTNDDLRNE